MSGPQIEEKECENCGRTVLEINLHENAESCVFCKPGITGP